MLRDRGGRRVGAYQFVYDITERQRDQERLKHAEAALRQAQKMESLGQLTGGVAHDFNNLLAVFASGLQLLERNPNPSPRVFEAMRRAVARGTGLTRHLLTFSRRQPVTRSRSTSRCTFAACARCSTDPSAGISTSTCHSRPISGRSKSTPARWNSQS